MGAKFICRKCGRDVSPLYPADRCCPGCGTFIAYEDWCDTFASTGSRVLIRMEKR